MFTGIVDHVGAIEAVRETTAGRRARIRSTFENLVAGESIAVDGACLTVTEPEGNGFSVDISPETLALTSAGQYREGSPLNLERALRMGDRIGGHVVTGHVDHTVVVAKTSPVGEYFRIDLLGVPPAFRKFLFPKGSVCLAGVSLTVNEVSPAGDGFSVLLIPHTLERTNLRRLAEGTVVNVEQDWLAKLFLNAQEKRMHEATAQHH